MRRFSAILAVLIAAGVAGAQPLTPERVRESEERLQSGARLLEQQRVAEALDEFAKARDLNPYDVRAPFYLAQSEFNLWQSDRNEARLARCRDYLSEAERIDPRFGGTFFLWGLIGVHTHNYEMAVAGFGSALDRGYQIHTSRSNLAQCLCLWGIEIARRNEYGLHEMNIRVLEDARDRLAGLKDDLRYSPSEREGFRDLWVNSLMNLLALHQRAENHVLAEKVALELIEIQPDNAIHPFNYGLVLGATQRFDEALVQYRKSLALSSDPAWTEPHLRIACILSLRGDAGAEEHFAAYLKSHPDSAEGHYRLGEHNVRLERFDDAVIAFRRSLELDPDDLTAIYKLSRALARRKDKSESTKWMALYNALEEYDRELGRRREVEQGKSPADGSAVPSDYGRERGDGASGPSETQPREAPGAAEKR